VPWIADARDAGEADFSALETTPHKTIEGCRSQCSLQKLE
jgi:hypothetical protein